MYTRKGTDVQKYLGNSLHFYGFTGIINLIAIMGEHEKSLWIMSWGRVIYKLFSCFYKQL